MPSQKDIYLKFIEFEESAAGIYLKLASRFAQENKDLSALWLEMAMQEKQHAGLLQFCVTDRLFAERLPDESEIRRFSELFQSMEKRASDPKLDANGAFLLAAELEGSEVNAIYCHLTTPLHLSMYLLKRKIVLSPADHIGQLAVAAKQYGVAASTLQTLEKLKESCPDSFS